MEKTHDLIIIGAGAAGLAAAQYAGRANLDTLVIEEKGEGGQAVFIDLLENYPGIVEPISGAELAARMRQQAERFGAKFAAGTVTGLGKRSGEFTVTVEREDGSNTVLAARTVLVATGAEHRKLGVPGEAEFAGKGVSWCASCDGPFFRGKHIVVAGGGDAACDEAAFLARLTDRVTMVHRRDRFRAQKALAGRTLANPHIAVRFNSKITEIRGTTGPGGKVASVLLEDTVTGAREELACDAVFEFVGMDPRTELASLAKRDEGGYILTDENMQTSIPGLFAAGDIRAKPFRQIVTAAADGAIAAHSAAQCIEELRCGVRG